MVTAVFLEGFVYKGGTGGGGGAANGLVCEPVRLSGKALGFAR